MSNESKLRNEEAGILSQVNLNDIQNGNEKLEDMKIDYDKFKLSENATKVLEKRYLSRDENGALIEDSKGMFLRVARAVAKADKQYVSDEELKQIEKKFFEMMVTLKFLPNSPTLMNAGKELGQLSACFVLPIKDSMEDIFKTLMHAALIHKSGGGTGFSFSNLRQKGAQVNSTKGAASGPISFLEVYNAATEAVKQGGTRRGANMGILRVDHPDILEFITCKQDSSKITNFNISVGITEKFMQAVETDEAYDLIDPHTRKSVKQISAKEVFDLIIDMAWLNGEPGIVFLDRLNKDNVVPELGEIESTNPCVTGNTWVLTQHGPKQVESLVGISSSVALNGVFYEIGEQGFFETGVKEVISIFTDRGYEVELTKNHLVRILNKDGESWKAAGELECEDNIVLSNNRGIQWNGSGTFEEGYLEGTMLNNSRMIEKYGLNNKDCVEERSIDFYKGFLQSIFDISGVISSNNDIFSLKLIQGDLENVQLVQRMLHRMGITSDIYAEDDYKIYELEGQAVVSDNKGCNNANGSYGLIISKDSLREYYDVIGFANVEKQANFRKLIEDYGSNLEKENFVAKVVKIVANGKKLVYDVQVPGANAFDANGIYVHNCGEQPLLSYESCNLGSINLSEMVKVVKNQGKVRHEIDYDKLRDTILTAIRFLDNVIDVNKYPLQEIGDMTRGTRKIGLGVMGWADLLCKLSIPYNSQKAITVAENVMEFIQKRAQEASIVLAKQKGPFPYYGKSVFKNTDIKVRNSTVTTIAPTGTLSIIAGVSSGIEPIFAISYIRNVMDNDELLEVNPLFKKIAIQEGFYSNDLMKRIAKNGSIKGFAEIPKWVQDVFVTSHDISPEWHVKMQAAFQKYTDNAVSKTVNLKHEATKEDVRNVFVLAYKTNCKGVTIYRDGSRNFQVLNIDKVKGSANSKDADAVDDNSLVPRQRPEITTGFTEKVKIGCGNLYITVNYDESGICEVFTNTGRAGGCPSQSEATSRLVSIALRSGIDEKSIVEQLKGIRCPSTIRQKGLKVMSCPDAIGRLIEKVMELQKNGKYTEDKESTELHNQQTAEDLMLEKLFRSTSDICPDCGKKVEHEGGCVVCRNCGYSKCG